MLSLLSTSALAAGLASLATATLDLKGVELGGTFYPVSEREYIIDEQVRKFKSTQQPRRKSMGFGPQLPHAHYRSNVYQIQTNGFSPLPKDTHPHIVAKKFVEDFIGSQLLDGRIGYWLRPDSYTDSTTGVSHVYMGQTYMGMPVTNAHMNINVKDGKVISYGSSFYTGTPEELSLSGSEGTSTHRDFCENIISHFFSHPKRPLTHGFAVQDNSQVTFEEELDAEQEHDLAGAYNLYHDNCMDGAPRYPFWFDSHSLNGDSFMTSVPEALAVFMLAAAPDVSFREMIAANMDTYLQSMVVNPRPAHLHASTGYHWAEFDIEGVVGAVKPVTVSVGYHQVPTKSGSVSMTLAYKFVVEMQDNAYEAYVSVASPHNILSVADWVSDSPIPPPKAPEERPAANYNVFTWGINDPAEGKRTIQLENDDLLASPVGWHSIPFVNDPSYKPVAGKKEEEFYRNTTTTWGNNVFAQENWEGANNFMENGRPDAGSKLAFNFTYDPKSTEKSEAEAEANAYINATVSQLFYTCNMIHDMFYRYGFTEEAGNFQQYNFGRGGKENDAVIANAQDGSGYNNANFMTPPDGTNGRMRMYLWNTALPYRDGDFEAGIVIHEFAHGISTRLTGGPLNSGCLGWGESGGMGEGWGDFFATSIRANKVYSDYAMGAWAANTPKGIRNYVYSTNETINPSTYKTLDKPGYWGVHAIGEVWAQILWVVQQGLIAKHGFSDTLYPPLAYENGTVPEGDFYKKDGEKLIPKHGNSLSIQLVVNGMKLQPCQPSFFDARDAIIQADQELTGGENFCTLWEGFSSRGLGPAARVDGRTPWGGGIRTNDYATPAQCKTFA
ncbi:Fungalysin metallopeptidase-domain-containing protein [Flagelloscypha sp. PMI_526]|nr:Fungalysin metallopeptidase-domain-containing protein [Flagelloscypha sp. PMI_526]